MRVIVFHNVAQDPQGRSDSMFRGYRSGDPLVPVARLEVDGADAVAVANEVYRLLNVGDDPSFGVPDVRALIYRENRNRSLSKGDVLVIDGAWYACLSAAWSEIQAPTYLARQASLYGTTPLYQRDQMLDVTLTTVPDGDEASALGADRGPRLDYTDVREALALILAATTDAGQVLASLDDAVANNAGDA